MDAVDILTYLHYPYIVCVIMVMEAIKIYAKTQFDALSLTKKSWLLALVAVVLAIIFTAINALVGDERGLSRDYLEKMLVSFPGVLVCYQLFAKPILDKFKQ